MTTEWTHSLTDLQRQLLGYELSRIDWKTTSYRRGMKRKWMIIAKYRRLAERRTP